jgi:hypothetical protein
MELGTMALRSEVIQCVIFNQVNFEVEMYVSCIIMFVRVRVSKTSSDLMDLVTVKIDVEFRINNIIANYCSFIELPCGSVCCRDTQFMLLILYGA